MLFIFILQSTLDTLNPLVEKIVFKTFNLFAKIIGILL